MEVFHNFHSNAFFKRSFNATYVALIPKKKGAKELRDFRPINLIGNIYKIIAKDLSETEKGNERIGRFTTEWMSYLRPMQ